MQFLVFAYSVSVADADSGVLRVEGDEATIKLGPAGSACTVRWQAGRLDTSCPITSANVAALEADVALLKQHIPRLAPVPTSQPPGPPPSLQVQLQPSPSPPPPRPPQICCDNTCSY